MTQEDKGLLLKDLCARLPYNVLVHIYDIDVCDYDNYLCEDDLAKFRVSSIQIKPHLRPMSSMTEEEKEEFDNLYNWSCPNSKFLRTKIIDVSELIDWLNANHFDYRGLIPKNLAIAVTEENNPYKE